MLKGATNLGVKEVFKMIETIEITPLRCCSDIVVITGSKLTVCMCTGGVQITLAGGISLVVQVTVIGLQNEGRRTAADSGITTIESPFLSGAVIKGTTPRLHRAGCKKSGRPRRLVVTKSQSNSIKGIGRVTKTISGDQAAIHCVKRKPAHLKTCRLSKKPVFKIELCVGLQKIEVIVLPCTKREVFKILTTGILKLKGEPERINDILDPQIEPLPVK